MIKSNVSDKKKCNVFYENQSNLAYIITTYIIMYLNETYVILTLQLNCIQYFLYCLNLNRKWYNVSLT